MRAGDGVDAAVGRDFQNGVTIFVHDENIAVVVLHGEVRTGKGGVGGVTAFKTRLPIVHAVHAGIGAAAGDGVQQAVGLDEVRVGLRGVGGKIHRPEAKKIIAGRHGEITETGRISGEEILLWNPSSVAIYLDGGFDGANAIGESAVPGNLAVRIEGADLKIVPRGLRQHRTGDKEPKYLSYNCHEKGECITSPFYGDKKGAIFPACKNPLIFFSRRGHPQRGYV